MDEHTEAYIQPEERIRRLYFPTDGSAPLVPLGFLPTQTRKDAPPWEATVRRRMHSLLSSDRGASVEEQRVLAAAGIPMVVQPDGKVTISPSVKRDHNRKRNQASIDRATGIAQLYGLEPGSIALVPEGFLARLGGKGTPPGEAQVRQRLHSLLSPHNGATVEEQRVLAAAGIPMVVQPDGKVTISPSVKREDTPGWDQAAVNRATRIAQLYGLAPNSTPLVPLGFLPKMGEKGGPRNDENRARHRMHDLLKRESGASAAEQHVLAQAQIPMVVQPDGKVTISPSVKREGGQRLASASSPSFSQPDVQPENAWPDQSADTSADMAPAGAIYHSFGSQADGNPLYAAGPDMESGNAWLEQPVGPFIDPATASYYSPQTDGGLPYVAEMDVAHSAFDSPTDTDADGWNYPVSSGLPNVPAASYWPSEHGSGSVGFESAPDAYSGYSSYDAANTLQHSVSDPFMPTPTQSGPFGASGELDTNAFLTERSATQQPGASEHGYNPLMGGYSASSYLPEGTYSAQQPDAANTPTQVPLHQHTGRPTVRRAH